MLSAEQRERKRVQTAIRRHGLARPRQRYFLTPEERKERQRAHVRAYYHRNKADPEFRRKQQVKNQAYKRLLRKTKPEARLNQRMSKTLAQALIA